MGIYTRKQVRNPLNPTALDKEVIANYSDGYAIHYKMENDSYSVGYGSMDEIFPTYEKAVERYKSMIENPVNHIWDIQLHGLWFD